jgi:hypothetical protein
MLEAQGYRDGGQHQWQEQGTFEGRPFCKTLPLASRSFTWREQPGRHFPRHRKQNHYIDTCWGLEANQRWHDACSHHTHAACALNWRNNNHSIQNYFLLTLRQANHGELVIIELVVIRQANHGELLIIGLVVIWQTLGGRWVIVLFPVILWRCSLCLDTVIV